MNCLFLLQWLILFWNRLAGENPSKHFVSSISLSLESSDLRIVCYYTNWSLYREAMPTLYPDHIDPQLCTHIHYAFADINPLTLAITPTEEHDIHWTDRLGMVESVRRDPQPVQLLSL